MVLPEHKVHKVLGGRQGVDAGPVLDVVQQSGQHGAGAARSPCPCRLVQQPRQVHAGLGEGQGLSCTPVALLAPSITTAPSAPRV